MTNNDMSILIATTGVAVLSLFHRGEHLTREDITVFERQHNMTHNSSHIPQLCVALCVALKKKGLNDLCSKLLLVCQQWIDKTITLEDLRNHLSKSVLETIIYKFRQGGHDPCFTSNMDTTLSCMKMASLFCCINPHVSQVCQIRQMMTRLKFYDQEWPLWDMNDDEDTQRSHK
jgi:hypothetical protein